MIYAVVAVKNAEKIKGKLERLKAEHHDRYAPAVYLVDYGNTATSLADKLGFNEDLEVEGFVVPFKGFSGYADQDIWNWVEARTK